MSSTSEFFDELGRCGHQPRLQRVRAVIRFEIANGARPLHRLVRVESGDVSVSDVDGPSDGTFRCSRAEFDDLVCGRTNAMASLLRGALTVAGDPELLVLAQRLFSCMPVEESWRPRTPTAGGQHE